GGERLRVDRSAGVPRVSGGALRLESGLKTGDPVFVAVDNPPSGLMGTEVITFSAWFKLTDLAGDGIDSRNFVWESIPNSALSLSLGTLKQQKVAQFRFRTENYRVLTQTDGPAVSPGAWHHVACVWNARAGHVRVYLNGSLVKE